MMKALFSLAIITALSAGCADFNQLARIDARRVAVDNWVKSLPSDGSESDLSKLRVIKSYAHKNSDELVEISAVNTDKGWDIAGKVEHDSVNDKNLTVLVSSLKKLDEERIENDRLQLRRELDGGGE